MRRMRRWWCRSSGRSFTRAVGFCTGVIRRAIYETGRNASAVCAFATSGYQVESDTIAYPWFLCSSAHMKSTHVCLIPEELANSGAVWDLRFCWKIKENICMAHTALVLSSVALFAGNFHISWWHCVLTYRVNWLITAAILTSQTQRCLFLE